jgi:hypothetical protein
MKTKDFKSLGEFKSSTLITGKRFYLITNRGDYFPAVIDYAVQTPQKN